MAFNSKDLTNVIHALSDDEVKYILKERYKRSLFHTAKTMLQMSDVNWRTHGSMLEALEDKTIKRKLIVMPRGSLKSSLGVTAYSIWSLLNDPNERILIDSAIYQNSKNFIREIRGLLETERVTSVFGSFRHPTNWGEGEITIAQRTKVYKEASVTASGIGASKVSQHYTKIIHDDMNAEKNSGTPEMRQKVLDHFKRNIAILEPDGEIVIIATRYSADDLVGYVLDNLVEIKIN